MISFELSGLIGHVELTIAGGATLDSWWKNTGRGSMVVNCSIIQSMTHSSCHFSSPESFSPYRARSSSIPFIFLSRLFSVPRASLEFFAAHRRPFPWIAFCANYPGKFDSGRILLLILCVLLCQFFMTCSVVYLYNMKMAARNFSWIRQAIYRMKTV